MVTERTGEPQGDHMSLTDVVISFLMAEELPGYVLAELLKKYLRAGTGPPGVRALQREPPSTPAPAAFFNTPSDGPEWVSG